MAADRTSSPMQISKRYQKLTQLEHIFRRPEMYLGGMELEKSSMWLLGSGLTEVEVSRGLLKVFEEITSNAFDNVSRGGTTRIDVEITPEHFSVKNNGAPIPVVTHDEHKVTIPELVFGHFLTGDNYNDDESRLTGGRNGYGAKLTNAFSTYFLVEVLDANEKKKMRLTFSNNMTDVNRKITSCSSGKSYTKVVAKIDFLKFGLQHATPLLLKAWERRVYDLAATTPANVSVFLNGEKLKVKGYKDYCQLWGECLYIKIDAEAEIAIYKESTDVPPPSFVNGVECNRGTHIQHWQLPLCKSLASVVKKTLKVDVSAAKMAKHVCITGNFLFKNPKFASQTKDVCTTHKRNFTHWEWSPSALKKATNYLKEVALRAAETETRKKMKTKVSRNVTIDKLDDARYAGTKRSSKCSLILTEGDSAKGFAISGFNVVGRDYYGCFPLRGKFLNVKAAALGKVMKNKEVQNVLKIFGLEIDRPPVNLRYGKCIIMADQDHDGSHIIGLLLNLFSHYKPWRQLLDDGFLQIFITPIIKARKGRKTQKFFSLEDYQQWHDQEDRSSWHIKYYKGLGTSTATEAQECFHDLENHLVPIFPGENGDEYMDLAFNKDRAGDRKQFLVHPPRVNLRPNGFQEFVCGRLFDFYNANNHRTLPHIMDGLKPTRRKILYALLIKKSNEERKVAALAAYVTEQMGYHHGEASLAKTIIGMAQTFVGASNINLLEPEGQFGTRSLGGKDAASARYIFTRLASITRLLFPDVDNETFMDHTVLEHQEEEGKHVEPVHLAPILPLIFINGEQGIGVGWSCDFPSYSPEDIEQVVRSWIMAKIAGMEHTISMPLPSWKGFQGTVEDTERNVVTKGTVESVMYRGAPKTNEFLITELPVRLWTMDFRSWLEKQDFVKRVIEESTLEKVRLRVLTSDSMTLAEVQAKCDQKLTNTIHKLMVCYNKDGVLTCYKDSRVIMREWCEHRATLYEKRRCMLLAKLKHRLSVLARERDYVDIIRLMETSIIGEERTIQNKMVAKGHGPDIDDLLKISIGKIMKGPWLIIKEMNELEKQVAVLEKKSRYELWIDDLDKLGFNKKRKR